MPQLQAEWLMKLHLMPCIEYSITTYIPVLFTLKFHAKKYIYWQFLIAYGGALHRPLIRSTTHWDCTQTRHPVRHICCGEVPTISKLVERSDDKLFANILYNQFHVLYNSLPEEMVLPYNFRCRPHNRQLVNKTSRLADASFIVRMLY